MAITINDIAKEAGVSLATVSRVLNNSGYVKDETRKRILTVIEKHNYSPSAIARSLSKNITNTIGVVLPDITNPFYGEIIRGVSEIADKNNLNILLCDSNESAEKELKSIKALKDQRIRGLLLTPTAVDNDMNSEYSKTIYNLNLPIVLVDGYLKYANFNGVLVDNLKGSYDATEALIKAGHKEIAILTGRMTSIHSKERFKGYQKALMLNNLPFKEDYIFYGDYTFNSGYMQAKEFLKLEPRPSAIFICSNMMTLGALKAFNEAGLNIPKDLALICFDKIEILSALGLNISCVNGDSCEIGRIGMQILIDELKNPDTHELKNITLTPELILLGSEKKF